MGTSVLPALRAAVVAQARAAYPGWDVRYGYGNTDAPSFEVLMVGASDPMSESLDEMASAQQRWAHANHTTRDEEGELSCIAQAWTGDGDQAGLQAAFEAAYGIVAGIENLIRADPTVGGVPGLLWTGFGPSHACRELQDDEGSIVLVVFTIAFRARI